ncbi:MAG: penicillin-binding protein 1C [Verrucomicrobiota bacterium]
MKRRLRNALALGLCGWVLWGLGYYVAPWFVHLPRALDRDPEVGLLVTDRDGRPLRRYLAGDLRSHEPVDYADFPESLIQATLAAEDSRFFSHGGIDFIAIGRALVTSVGERRFVSGASTVTQQTIKLYRDPKPRSWRTKIYEMLAARKLEMCADKATILTAYLNRLPYGNQYSGAAAAAQGYLGKPVGDLSLAESALLAGLPNKPSRLNPWRNRAGAETRQRWVIDRIEAEQWATSTELSAARSAELNFLQGPGGAFHAPHALDWISIHRREALEEAASENRPLTTTIDLSLQQFVEATVGARLAQLRFEQGESSPLQAAVVVLDNQTREVLALTGSRSFREARSGQVNGAWSARSAGSTLKPFTYLLALESGHTAASVLPDTPIEYITATGSYRPFNFDRRFQGPVSLRYALANSLNVPAVKILDDIGGPGILAETLEDGLGFTSLNRSPSEYGLGLTLGNVEVRLLELTNAYATLAALGMHRPYRLVQSQADSPEEPNASRIFSESNSWLIADILSDAQARAASFGLDNALTLPFRVAAKTGTSTDFRDNWTVGFTPDHTVGVWVGRFDNRPVRDVTGALGAGPIFREIMLELYREHEPRWYQRPESIQSVETVPLLGLAASAESRAFDVPTQAEWFAGASRPAPARSEHFTENGKPQLSLTYHHWWHSEHNHLRQRAEIAPVTLNDPKRGFRIVSPAAGTTAFLDPDLPWSGNRFPLAITGPGFESITWESDSLAIEVLGEQAFVILQAGEHLITATDPQSGISVTTEITVRAL